MAKKISIGFYSMTAYKKGDRKNNLYDLSDLPDLGDFFEYFKEYYLNYSDHNHLISKIKFKKEITDHVFSPDKSIEIINEDKRYLAGIIRSSHKGYRTPITDHLTDAVNYTTKPNEFQGLPYLLPF